MPQGASARGCCAGFCGFLATAGVVVLVYWAIFQPHHIRAAVDSAALSNLTVVVSNSVNASSSVAEISYRLAVGLNLYNPSVRVDIYYDAVDAELRFRGAVVGPAANGTSPSVFYQRRRTREVVKVEFDYRRAPGSGGGGVAVGRDVAGELARETRSGAPVSLELDVRVRVRYVFRMFKLRQKPRIRCSLRIPVKTEGRHRGFAGAIASGAGDQCSVKY